ncbi:VOC family protein [Streptomyces sp. NPDC054775]
MRAEAPVGTAEREDSAVDINFHEDGAPAWVELNTADPEASARFYGALFGWTFTPGFSGRRQALLAELGGRPTAAITATASAQRGAWTTYVHVTDADKAVDKVMAAGGSMLTPVHDRGLAGRAAVLTDHAGTVFGVWEAVEHEGSGVAGEPGSYFGGELITDDVQSSADFYGQVFGWTLGDPYGPLNRRDIHLGGQTISVLLPRPAAMPAEIPPYWDVYFTVADAEQTAEAAVRLGAAVLMPPTASDHGHIAVFADPTGAVFTVLAPSH